MTIAAFRGTCPICGHDHDADNAEFQRLLKAAPESPAKEQPGEQTVAFDFDFPEGAHRTKAAALAALAAPDVASMVKRLEECAKFCDRTDMRSFAVICRDAATLLAKLGQGWIPVAWAVTWNGEMTDNIFCFKETAMECMARMNRDYPNDIRTVVPLAMIPPPPERP